MTVNNNQIGDYPVSMDSGNENFIELVESLWRPENPKRVNRYSICWAVCSYLCYNLLLSNGEDTRKGSVAQSLCKTLIYGWKKPLNKDLFLNFYWAEEYLGITHEKKYNGITYTDILSPSISFLKIEKDFNPTAWQELKPFLISLSDVDIVNVGTHCFTSSLV